MIETIKVFVGYDPREAAAYHVCVNSLIRHSSLPLAIHPLALDNFAGFYREIHRDGSNAFVYSRFLVPWLCKFQGFALYLDGDMLLRGDVEQIWHTARADKACAVVKHDYRTKYSGKYFGAKNEDYPRKNWSSVILWNCAYYPNRCLTPQFVAGKDGAYLHRFAWLADDQIDTLPADWNHLCAEYEPKPAAKLYHYTIGIPAFQLYGEQEGSVEWWQEFNRAMEPVKV